MPSLSEEQVAGVLASAARAVAASGVDGPLHEAAFTAAVALLSGGTTAPPSPVAPAKPVVTQNGSGDSDDPIDAVAAYLGLEADGLHRIFAVQEGVPELKVKASTLPQAKGAAAVDIALLVMAARQGAGLDEYSPVKVLHEVTKNYGKFDSGNYASALKKLDHMVLQKGSGRDVARKLTRPGIEAAAAKAEEYIAAAAS